MKAFESVGVWFVPTEPDVLVAGTLTFSQYDGLTLKLTGTFQQNWTIETARYPVVHGVVSESPYGKYIALFDCFATNLRIGMPGISLETIRANHGFAGSAFVDSDTMLFDEVSLNFTPLAEWLDYSGLERLPDPGGTGVTWHRPQQRDCKVLDATISTSFGLNITTDILPRTVSLEETPALMIHDFGHSTAADIHCRFVAPLSRLMTFVSEDTALLDRYRLYRLKEGETVPVQFDRLYSPIRSTHKAKQLSKPDLLFSLAQVPGDFESFLQSWFCFDEAHPDFCTMFFSYCYERSGFLESRFLFQMLAAECLAREAIHDARILSFFEHARSLLLRVGGNEPYGPLAPPAATVMATPTLFATLINRHWSVIHEVVGTTEARFIEVLFETLDHVNNRGTQASDVVTGRNLYWLLERLAAVIKVCILKLLGFTDDKVTHVITANPKMAHLKLIKAPWGMPINQE